MNDVFQANSRHSFKKRREGVGVKVRESMIPHQRPPTARAGDQRGDQRSHPRERGTALLLREITKENARRIRRPVEADGRWLDRAARWWARENRAGSKTVHCHPLCCGIGCRDRSSGWRLLSQAALRLAPGPGNSRDRNTVSVPYREWRHDPPSRPSSCRRCGHSLRRKPSPRAQPQRQTEALAAPLCIAETVASEGRDS